MKTRRELAAEFGYWLGAGVARHPLDATTLTLVRPLAADIRIAPWIDLPQSR